MSYSEEDIRGIVRDVLAKISTEPREAKISLGVFSDINEAISAAKHAQKTVRAMPMELREKIISTIRKKTIEEARVMAEMGVQETGMGNVEHKVLKHRLVAEKTPGTECIATTARSGDNGLSLTERGPFGVIGAVTPSTNPSETVLCNTIGMLAGGNTVVFNPHPGAKNVSNYAVDLLNRASLEAGGPDNIAVSLDNPTLESGGILFKHPDVPLLVATGGAGVVTAILSSGKRGIGAGAGNPPVLVDETADIEKAAIDIVSGATFDNNLPCIAEKEIIAVDKITDELIHYMMANGSYMLSPHEAEKLAELVFITKNGRRILNRKCVGVSADRLLEMIGRRVDAEVRCIIFEGGEEHPLISEELMMPILGIVRVPDVDEGIETALRLEHGFRHSAHMHSKNVDNLTRYGRALDTTVYVKNGPSYSAIGFGGEGYCTFTIASRTGDGLTCASTFSKARLCVMKDGLCIR